TFDAASFQDRIDDYQISETYTADGTSANVFDTVDKFEINGFENISRLDSQPITLGRFNVFGEATYTYTYSVISSGIDLGDDGIPGGGDDTNLKGNYVPEVPRHFATLTLGFAERGLWDASVTWSHIGGFYTDVLNTPYGG